ncbi:ATP-binding cassette sub-family B member 8, mitochondrial [Oryzias melastigma]|uniref:ATP-binding cassette sub-family B member 8, mitochondrial n=1 Tax=Oryzias melastigma TaxID=30732 RepID=A0A834FHA3_ORYME|nr:ATP-binding cassette sub-family B member 8, mitochondrial [Oryzias melastigma]
MFQLICCRHGIYSPLRAQFFSSPCSKTGVHWKLSRWFSSGTHARSSSQQLESAVSRFWRLTQRAVRRSPKGIKPQGLKFILGPAFLTVSTRLFCHVAHCQEDVNNNTPLEVVAKDSAPEFKWHILWEFVKPQLFALICAVVLAFGAAILNIQIPLMLGDLVNVVARFLRDNTGTYVGEMTAPALKLLGLYGVQWMAAGCSVRAGRVSRRSRQLEEQHVDKGWRCQVEQSLNFYKHGPGQTNCLCRVTDGATVTLDRQLKADLLILLKCTSSRWAFAASPAIRAECCQDAR